MKQLNNNQTKKTKWYLRWWMLPVYIIVFAIILTSLVNRGEQQEQLVNNQPIQHITEVSSPERAIEAKFIQALGEKTNMGERRVRQIRLYTYDHVNNYQNVDIEYMASENLTTGWTRDGMWLDAQKVLQNLPMVLSSQVMKITLNPHLKLVDQYGNESVEKVMTIRITRETWEKINWDNFLIENIPKIAETYSEHPALSK